VDELLLRERGQLLRRLDLRRRVDAQEADVRRVRVQRLEAALEAPRDLDPGAAHADDQSGLVDACHACSTALGAARACSARWAPRRLRRRWAPALRAWAPSLRLWAPRRLRRRWRAWLRARA